MNTDDLIARLRNTRVVGAEILCVESAGVLEHLTAEREAALAKQLAEIVGWLKGLASYPAEKWLINDLANAIECGEFKS